MARLPGIIALICAVPTIATAQAEIVGRVVSDSGGVPIAGVEVSLPRLKLAASTDSAGRFRFRDLKPGDHLLRLRALGFRADSSVVEIDADEVTMKDFVLHRQVVALPETRVTAPEIVNKGKMASFAERQKVGIGHFIDRKMLEKDEGRTRTGDMLARVPGVTVSGSGIKAFIASGRSVTGGSCAFCRPEALSAADRLAGAQASRCYMDVYLDGILVWDESQRAQGLFDINSLQLSQIEGIEVYTSASQIPVQFNKTSHGCGAMLVWTRIS